MNLTYVTYPGRVPAQISWGLLPLSSMFTSPGGRTQGIERTSLWKASLSFKDLDPTVSTDYVAELKSFLNQLARPYRVFYLKDYSYTARGSLSGTPTVNGAGQTGSTLSTSGWTASAANVLKDGDYLTLSTGQMCMVAGDVSADASGNAVINVEPPIRSAPVNGSAINVTTPTCVMHMPKIPIPTSSPPVLTDLSFDCLEWLL